MDAFVSCAERVKESNGSDEMNSEEKIEKVNCKLCGEEIDNPFDTAIKAVNYLRMPVFHFTRKHVKELREYLKTKTLADLLDTHEDSLYPIYLEFYADGDLLTATIEVHDLLSQFIVSNVSASSTLEALK